MNQVKRIRLYPFLHSHHPLEWLLIGRLSGSVGQRCSVATSSSLASRTKNGSLRWGGFKAPVSGGAGWKGEPRVESREPQLSNRVSRCQCLVPLGGIMRGTGKPKMLNSNPDNGDHSFARTLYCVIKF